MTSRDSSSLQGASFAYSSAPVRNQSRIVGGASARRPDPCVRRPESPSVTVDRYARREESTQWNVGQSFDTTFRWQHQDGRDKLLEPLRRGQTPAVERHGTDRLVAGSREPRAIAGRDDSDLRLGPLEPLVGATALSPRIDNPKRRHIGNLRRAVGLQLILAALSACLAPVNGGQEGPETPPAQAWTLDSNNWQLGKDLLPDAVLDRVKKGDYTYRVVPVDREHFKQNYSQRFWDASAANAGKFDIDPETCGLKDVATGEIPEFYFGYPFPTIDPADTQAACKMAWNFTAANQMGNGQGASFTIDGIDGGGQFRRLKLWAEYNVYVGRSAGPIANPDHLRTVVLNNLTEPRDADGVAGLSRSINDWTSQDEVWFYLPAMRRVRRVNAATRSDPIAGLDIFADDANCYGGKVEYYKWKLIGEGSILAPVLSPEPLPQHQVSPTRWEVALPYFKAAYEKPGAKGAPWQIVENLNMVPRPVWIIEGQSEDPYYNFGKVIMYMDKDMYRIYWKLVYNRAGEYFYNAMCAYHWSKSADGTFTAVTPNMVIGVNDKTNRAAIAGRYSSQFIETNFDDKHFSLSTLSRLSD